MEDIKIDKNVPIPLYSDWKRVDWADIIRKLEIGDSFYVDRILAGRNNRAWGMAKTLGIKITSRVEGVGTRIWRVK